MTSMQVRLKNNAIAGDVCIPPGQYQITLKSESQQVLLYAGERQYLVPAIRRRSAAQSARPVRTESFSFTCAGGRRWSLVIQHPKTGEWVAFLEYTYSEQGAEEK